MTSRDHRHLSAYEATSFYSKFKDLWLAGYSAHLNFETQAGQAWATLRVALGPHPMNVQPPHPQQHRRVSPAQQRRRERREAARAEADVDHVAATAEADHNTDKEKALAEEVSARKVTDNAEEVIVNESDKENEAGKVSKAPIIDVAAVRTATGRLVLELANEEVRPPVGTEPIPQVDGGFDTKDSTVTYNFTSKYGEEDILYSLEELFPEKSAVLLSRVRVTPLRAEHLCTVALKVTAGQRLAWPVMWGDLPEVFTAIERI